MSNNLRHSFDRRSFLAAASSTFVWPFLNMPNVEAAARIVRTTDYPFKLGVASGDPAADGVVIWTRLAPDAINGGGMPPEDVRVRWQVATDEKMTRVVRKGTATASKDWAHSVHVEVQGLRPDRTY
jgi:alkaline phosphatase D